MTRAGRLPPWTRRLVALLFVGSAIALYFTFRGHELGRVRVADEPRTIRIEASPGEPLVFWTEVELRNPSHAHLQTSRLPHLLDYQIEVLHGEQLVETLRCNPFETHVFRWSSERSMKTRSYLGRIDNCAVKAPARDLTIRVHRAWRDRDPAFRFAKTVLVIEQ